MASFGSQLAAPEAASDWLVATLPTALTSDNRVNGVNFDYKRSSAAYERDDDLLASLPPVQSRRRVGYVC